jgi:hypothetical protein
MSRRRISAEKRASVYRTDQLSDGLKLAGNGVLGRGIVHLLTTPRQQSSTLTEKRLP